MELAPIHAVLRVSIVLVLLLAFAPDWLLTALWLVFGIALLVAWGKEKSEREAREGTARYCREVVRRRREAARHALVAPRAPS